MAEDPSTSSGQVPTPAPTPVAAVKPAAPKPAPKPLAPPWPYDEKVLCYPNMIFHELVVCLGTVVVIWIWSIMMNAPLEEAANGNLTPNPSRAPWYFLGLQEMLVYFDPWIAGVLLPQFIVQGLILLPYIDTNPTQQGYYSYKGRELEFWVMSIGFFMWFALIIVGSTMRGPSWQLYMPWESWLVHKPNAAPTWNISTRAGIPTALMLMGLYFGGGMALPALLFKDWFKEKGIIRYALIMTHVLVMFAVPLKMILRIGFNVKYVLALVTPIGSINF